MMTPENPRLHFRNKNNVGGRKIQPPTSCLPAAYSAAYPAAYVERTRGHERIYFRHKRLTGHSGQNKPKFGGPHARTVSG
jgi:hypothetical protein